MHMCIYTHEFMPTYMYVCMCACMHVSIYIYMYVYTCVWARCTSRRSLQISASMLVDLAPWFTYFRLQGCFKYLDAKRM